MSNTLKVSYPFRISKDAWTFVRACDAAGVPAGFPDLRTNAVTVAITTGEQLDIADMAAIKAGCTRNVGL